MKYIFKQVDDISGHNAETTIEFSADYLPTILEHFEMFLRGSGFHATGTLEFVDYEDPYTTPKFECAEENYEDEENDPAYEFDDGQLTKEQLDQIKETHEWAQTLRNDSEWSFPRQRPAEGESKIEPWEGVSPSVAMQWTVKELMKEKSVCSVCKIDVETMMNHECWDKNCPKGKDAN